MPASDAVSSPADASDNGCGVHIRFAPSQGPRLRRPQPTPCAEEASLWTDRPILMQRADGTYELIGTSTRLDGVARWVLSHGAAAEVQGPERLREQVVAEARRIVDLYEPDPRDEDSAREVAPDF